MVPTPSDESPGYPEVAIAFAIAASVTKVPKRSPRPMSATPLSKPPKAPRMASTPRIVTPVGRFGFGCMAVIDSLRS